MPSTRKPINVPAEIERLVKRIVKKFHPEQIILFGSQGRGDAGPDSDINLLVVMPVARSVSETRLELSLALPDLPVPVDVIVTAPENLAWRKDIVGTIECPTTRKGKRAIKGWGAGSGWLARAGFRGKGGCASASQANAIQMDAQRTNSVQRLLPVVSPPAGVNPCQPIRAAGLFGLRGTPPKPRRERPLLALGNLAG
jgi:predicted nucleotidyltransferase